ncbi:hypothetical protein Blut17040_03120 [Blautia luti]|uniref:Ferrous iron transport protein A n=1 Tax=Blautia luti DSM 14534 = JCM 17040 TaxID=649762 RepID=A0A844GHV4_9FIRM|nr:FeoA family protein [Blautia luti]MTD61636.1 ferrous iron transport protein A [Blautia luti DSM 14534 = JCM 17040]BEI59283.1 hypothetical protein Blut17040_03120 [Blautia luti]
MQPLSHSSQGNTYTIKWMFGLPEVLNTMHNMDIHEGSTIQVLQKFSDSLIISTADRRVVLGNEVADRIQV